MHKNAYYGWYICVGCALLLFCTSGLSVNAFSIYQPFIMAQNNFTNTQTSSIITAQNLFSLAGMFLVRLYYKKLDVRIGMPLAGLVIACGYITYSLARTIQGYWLGAAIIGFGYGFGTIVACGIALERWFIKRRTFAISLCSASTGLATLGLPSVLTLIVEKKGLNTAFVLEGLFIATVMVVIFIIMRNRPEDIGLKPYGYGEPIDEKKGSAIQKVFLKKRDWPILVVLALCCSFTCAVSYSHLSVFMNAQGFAPQTRSVAIMISGTMLTLGKLFYGWLSDRLSMQKRMLIFGGLILVGYVMLVTVGTSIPRLFIAFTLFGFGLALISLGLMEWASDFSAPEDYTKNAQRFNLLYILGNLVLSTTPGILADRFGGSYIPAYLISIACTALLILIIEWFYKFRAKNNN